MNPSWLALGGAIVTSVTGQALLKAGAGAAAFRAQLLDWRTLLGLALYGGAAMLYIVALRRLPVSVALPCTAIGYVAVAVFAHFALGEPLGPSHVVALALIVSGVVMLALS